MEPAVLGSFEIKADLLGSSNRNLIALVDSKAGFSTSFTSNAITIVKLHQRQVAVKVGKVKCAINVFGSKVVTECKLDNETSVVSK